MRLIFAALLAFFIPVSAGAVPVTLTFWAWTQGYEFFSFTIDVPQRENANYTALVAYDGDIEKESGGTLLNSSYLCCNEVYARYGASFDASGKLIEAYVDQSGDCTSLTIRNYNATYSCYYPWVEDRTVRGRWIAPLPSPVPLPASAGLLAAGLGLIGLFRLKKDRHIRRAWPRHA